MTGSPPAIGRETLVRVCTDTSAGYDPLSAAREAAEEFPVVETGSIGLHEHEPMVALTHDGTTAFHSDPSQERVRTLVEGLAEGSTSDDDALAVVDHDPERETLPTPDTGPLSVGTRRILARCGWVSPAALDDYGAFAVDRVGDDPSAALETVDDVGLLGRGRGDGEIVVKVNVEDTSDPGVVFVPMHFIHGAVNELTQHELDPTSKIPEYKVTSVKITPVGPDPTEEPLPLDPPVEGAAEGPGNEFDASASGE